MLNSLSGPHGVPTPAYIFRGHSASIQALHFFQGNRYFVSGDSDGWLIVWKMTNRRAAAAWKGHEGSISGIKDWCGTRLITHGRDHKLRVWQVRDEDFEHLDTTQPTTAPSGQPRQPWLLHSFDMNALNFCSFAVSPERMVTAEAARSSDMASILIAAPNGLDNGGVDIFQLPSEKRVSKIQSDKAVATGMVMTLRLFHDRQTDKLVLVTGYEDGRVSVYIRKEQNIMPVWIWDRVMLEKPHAQPVLSLDVVVDPAAVISSSADALIVKYDLPSTKAEDVKPTRTNDTRHAGQQDLKVRDDRRIFATAGWDKAIRVYSTKTLKELAVLQWHQSGCHALAFASVLTEGDESNDAGNDQLNSVQLMKLQQEKKTHSTHWLVAGSKDGKISLWDIY